MSTFTKGQKRRLLRILEKKHGILKGKDNIDYVREFADLKKYCFLEDISISEFLCYVRKTDLMDRVVKQSRSDDFNVDISSQVKDILGVSDSNNCLLLKNLGSEK